MGNSVAVRERMFGLLNPINQDEALDQQSEIKNFGQCCDNLLKRRLFHGIYPGTELRLD